MAFVTALFDLLKGIAWPVVILVVALSYKDELRRLVDDFRKQLPRMRELGPTGVKLDPAEQQSKAIPDIVSSSSELTINPVLPRATQAVQQIESNLRSDVDKLTTEARIPVLVRELAEARLAAAFEHIYSFIFGTQIAGLRRLKEAGGRVAVDDARTFFEMCRQQYPSVHILGFEGWIMFLIKQELIRESDGHLDLTEIGRDFLLYIDIKRLPDNKPF